jgi:hypothetical protein
MRWLGGNKPEMVGGARFAGASRLAGLDGRGGLLSPCVAAVAFCRDAILDDRRRSTQIISEFGVTANPLSPLSLLSRQIEDYRGVDEGRCREPFATGTRPILADLPVAKGSRHRGAERILDFWTLRVLGGAPINVVQKSAASARREMRLDRENSTLLAMVERFWALDFWTFGNGLDRSKSP